VLQHDASTEFTFAAQFVAELRFRAVDIDPGTGEIQGDQGGFPEEYPLEDVELCTPDFMSEVKIVDIDFRAMWEAMDASGEVLEKCVLQTRELESAVTNITACLGMRSKDREHAVDMVTKNVSSHSFHIVGTLVGSIKFLIRAQIQQSDEKAACLLKMAVRSPDAVVSRAVASCIK